ncbi:solute carrier family 35 (UDP-sugar transporter), member A1/2/3 [Kwoniella heveanensis CBS 569]|uniref:Solute carrier family 35 (UDP-sugar transporter), member A1/2/3 n=1 Tax=Kwoniella heveanensis BCC8398 TaxID=1296120 RepID=A0A1B9GPI9_9TREE|nr:solute carrier family 35 (UDP-sugar transporter), member A1/2/3 [Kwoniella heveanensis BCC8398]OCF39658.1 solute carrier family 35 (UDP-sugar transporter), member A1/2/3 [Kwoniella heveanensis CBS 569]
MSRRGSMGALEEERSDETGSVGKVGSVSGGMTKPKRRLSRATESSSPPGSPKAKPRDNYNPVPSYKLDHQDKPKSSPLASLSHGASSSNNYHNTTYNRANPPRLDEKIGMVGYAAQMAAASREKEGPPMLWGIELKWISLMTLALQNAFLTIIMHYSRIATPPGKTYSAATAVLLNELLKGFISVVIALKRIDTNMNNSPAPPVYSEKNLDKDLERRPNAGFASILHSTRIRALGKAVFSPDCYKLSVPAILYVIQNNLQYVAASNLDVATFQVTYQMKILTTAFFSVLMLRKRLSKAKWLSLFMLAVGVGIVQIQTTAAPATHSHHKTDESIVAPERVMRPMTGFLAVTLACMTSGLAGVYFEFILKSSSSSSAPPPDLWVRNTQLSLFSLVPALVPIIVAPAGPPGMGYSDRVMAAFSNFNGWAIGTVLTQTFGGLVTALVIRYSDNIMKGFATSLSIVISFLASVALFSYPITVTFVLGASIVLFATYIYNSPSLPSPQTSRTTVAVAPGSPISTTAPILGEPDRPSRVSSMVNLLGLRSNDTSRKPSLSDLKAPLLGSGGSGTNGSGGGGGNGGGGGGASQPESPFLGTGFNLNVNGGASGRSSPHVPHSAQMGGN